MNNDNDKRSGLETLIKSRAYISRTTKGVDTSPDVGNSDLGAIGTWIFNTSDEAKAE